MITLYSGLLDTPIPADFTGAFVAISGGVLNSFYGAVGAVRNNLVETNKQEGPGARAS